MFAIVPTIDEEEFIFTKPDALQPVKKGKGVCGCESDIHIPSFGAGVTPEKYDSVISQYVE